MKSAFWTWLLKVKVYTHIQYLRVIVMTFIQNRDTSRNFTLINAVSFLDVIPQLPWEINSDSLGITSLDGPTLYLFWRGIVSEDFEQLLNNILPHHNQLCIPSCLGEDIHFPDTIWRAYIWVSLVTFFFQSHHQYQSHDSKEKTVKFLYFLIWEWVELVINKTVDIQLQLELTLKWCLLFLLP